MKKTKQQRGAPASHVVQGVDDDWCNPAHTGPRGLFGPTYQPRPPTALAPSTPFSSSSTLLPDASAASRLLTAAGCSAVAAGTRWRGAQNSRRPPTDTPAHAQTAGGGQLMASDGMRVTRRCPQTTLRPSQPPHTLAAAAAGRTHAQTAARTCWNRRRRWWLAASTGIRRLLRHRRPTKQPPQHA